MPIRIRLSASRVALPLRYRTHGLQCESRQPGRTFADATNRTNELPKSEDGKGPNTEQLPHISEEAAAIAEVQGEAGPDVSQGTPVADVLKRDKEAQKNLPKVMKDSLKASSAQTKRPFSTTATRPFSTSTRRRQNIEPLSNTLTAGPDTDLLATFTQAQNPQKVSQDASASGELMRLSRRVMLSEPMPQPYNFRDRYVDIIDQFVGLMIKDGKKAQAQRFMTAILNYIRTTPAPTLNPQRPLLAGHPPAAALPLNPVMYVALAIDSIAPLMRVKNIKGAAGGGRALPIPVPLTQRQRRRTAIKWVLDAAGKRQSRASGRNMFPHKVAEELIAVVQGTSAIWDRRSGLHKTSVLARANVARRKMTRKRNIHGH